jgi:hypothetical protein
MSDPENGRSRAAQRPVPPAAIGGNLDRLLEALNKMRKANDTKPAAARQIREGVDLAVKLADRLQQNAPGPRAA